MIIDYIYSTLLLAFVGGIIYHLQSWITFVTNYIRSYFVVSIVLKGRTCAAVDLILFYLSQNSNKHSFKTLRLVNNKEVGIDAPIKHSKDFFDKTYTFLPYSNLLSVTYGGYKFYFSLSESNEGERVYGRNEKVINIWCYGRDRTILQDFIKHMVNYAREEISNYLRISDNDHVGWSPPTLTAKRSMDSLILKKDITHSLCNDIDTFLSQKKWYNDMGIPYRRGYLLYGPSGCGKTSLIKAVATKFDLDILYLSMNKSSLDNAKLQKLFSGQLSSSIIVIEDIDCVFNFNDNTFLRRSESDNKKIIDDDDSDDDDKTSKIYDLYRTKYKCNDETARMICEQFTNESKFIKGENSGGKNKVTLAGILNAIDGLSTGEDYLIFMTSNHPEKLDSALTRDGRIDMKIFIDYPDQGCIEKLFKRFFEDATSKECEMFAKSVLKKGYGKVSVASIQGFLLKKKFSERKPFIREIIMDAGNHEWFK
jgi:mitochondrial chaperone BCS1